MSTKNVVAVVLLVAAFVLPRAKDLVTHLPTVNPPDSTTQVVTIPEKQIWMDLAAWCEAGQVKDTDELRRVANGLKTLGKLTDVSRLDKYTTNSPVTAEVIQTLRQ